MIAKLKRVMIVTGTPGVGKTTVSEALADRLRASHIDLTKMVKESSLKLGIDSARGSVIADLRGLQERLRAVVEHSLFDVIIEGHFASDVVHPEMVSYAFVLRMHPDLLRRRLRERGYDRRKIKENLASEILDVCLFDTVERYDTGIVDEIDVTGRAVEDVVERIYEVLTSRRRPKIGIVDWLGELEDEERLEEFF